MRWATKYRLWSFFFFPRNLTKSNAILCKYVPDCYSDTGLRPRTPRGVPLTGRLPDQICSHPAPNPRTFPCPFWTPPWFRAPHTLMGAVQACPCMLMHACIGLLNRWLRTELMPTRISKSSSAAGVPFFSAHFQLIPNSL